MVSASAPAATAASAISVKLGTLGASFAITGRSVLALTACTAALVSSALWLNKEPFSTLGQLRLSSRP